MLLPIFVIAAMGEAFGDGSEMPATPTESSAPQGDGNASTGSEAPQGDLEHQVLSHPRIRLTTGARRDIEMGRVDQRLLRVLLILADQHHLGSVGPFVTGHSYFVKGTTKVSNHIHGRAVDIGVVDGNAVSPSNGQAYRAAETVASLPRPLRPSELGAPWRIQSDGVYSFTKGHDDHLHIGYKA